MNWLIIILNALVFIYELRIGNDRNITFIEKYALIPEITSLFGLSNYRFLSNIFMHGGWLHFISNMWILFIFGDNVEDKMGSLRYLAFYMLSGFVASFTHYILNMNSPVPALGASGAIAGVMAAYMFLFPGSKILSFVPIFIIPLFIPIPAILFIGIWFIIQLFSGTISLLSPGTETGIAFWAHIGGFVAGWVFYKRFLRKGPKTPKTYYRIQ